MTFPFIERATIFEAVTRTVFPTVRRVPSSTGLARWAVLGLLLLTFVSGRAPGKEEDLSASLVKSLAGALVGKAGGVVVDKVGVTLGLTEPPTDFERYFSIVNHKLDEMKEELNEVGDATKRIERTQVGIQASLFEVSFQQVVLDYRGAAVVIEQNFATYRSAANAMATGDEVKRRQGARLMFGILQPNNIRKVDQAMETIAGCLLGADSVSGIYQRCAEKLVVHLKLAASNPKSAGALAGSDIGDSLGVFDHFPKVYTSTIETQIMPIFSASLNVLLKGSILLDLAYRGTIQSKQLEHHETVVRQASAAVAGFWYNNTRPEVIEPLMEAIFKANLQHVPPALRDKYPWQNREVASPSPYGDGWPKNYRFAATQFGGHFTAALTQRFRGQLPENGWKRSTNWERYAPPEKMYALFDPASFEFGRENRYHSFRAGDEGGGKFTFGFNTSRDFHWEVYRTPSLHEYCAAGDAPEALRDLAAALVANGMASESPAPEVKELGKYAPTGSGPEPVASFGGLGVLVDAADAKVGVEISQERGQLGAFASSAHASDRVGIADLTSMAILKSKGIGDRLWELQFLWSSERNKSSCRIIDKESGLALSVITSDDRGDVTLKPVASGVPMAQLWRIGNGPNGRTQILSLYSQKCLTAVAAGESPTGQFMYRATTCDLGDSLDGWSFRWRESDFEGRIQELRQMDAQLEQGHGEQDPTRLAIAARIAELNGLVSAGR